MTEGLAVMAMFFQTKIGQTILTGKARDVRDLIRSGEDVLAKDRVTSTPHVFCPRHIHDSSMPFFGATILIS